MTTTSHNDAVEMLKDEIKALQANCVEACHVIENNPPDEPCVNLEEVTAKCNNYVKGLATEVQNSNTRICTNENIIAVQFLNDMKEKITHLDELSCFAKACINENDAEINRLKTQIAIAKEAMAKPKTNVQEVTPEHLSKAKDKFLTLKDEIHGLIHCLFPDCREKMLAVLGELMQTKQKDAHAYLKVEIENVHLVEMLRDMNIVTANPYDRTQFKLTY